MDIVKKIDGLGGASVLTGDTNPMVVDWIKQNTATLYALAMPRWASAPLPEFATHEARVYFKKNKEAIIGPFSDRLAESARLIDTVNLGLTSLAPLIKSPSAINGELSVDDIHLFAHLRSLSIVRGVQYPQTVDDYRQMMSEKAGVQLHDAIAT